MITRYWILESECAQELIAQVNQWIADGWKPLGGLVMTCSMDAEGERYWWHAQAMIKTEAAA